MFTINDLNKDDQATVLKLPEELRQSVIDSIGKANKAAEAARTALRMELKETVTDKTGKQIPAKGAIQLYGLMRFPVSLHPEQWDRLLGFVAEIKAFVDANRARSKEIAAKYRSSNS